MRTERPRRPRRVGVIGQSGVGKSTVLNALISERLPLLPQGGVGPLTAVPIEVCHARTPYLEVGCWGSSRLAQLLGACERWRELGQNARAPDGDLTLVRLAAQVTSGSQFGHHEQQALENIRSFLIQCRDASGAVSASHRSDAISRVRRAVASGDAGKFIRIEAGVDLPALMTALAEHASGSLAPLTASIELGWDAPLLEGGVTLVDLPGLGVANDLHPSVTRALAGSFDMILLVVDRSGVSEASARLLVQVFRDLSSSEDVSQRPEPSLVVAVAKLDQVADASVSRCRSTSAWRDACASAATRARELVRSQLESEVNRQKAAAGALIRRVVCRVQVVPVFPLEYQRIHRGDPEEPPKLDLSATGIARLAVAIRDPEPSGER